jgi:hypothetical protein
MAGGLSASLLQYCTVRLLHEGAIIGLTDYSVVAKDAPKEVKELADGLQSKEEASLSKSGVKRTELLANPNTKGISKAQTAVSLGLADKIVPLLCSTKPTSSNVLRTYGTNDDPFTLEMTRCPMTRSVVSTSKDGQLQVFPSELRTALLSSVLQMLGIPAELDTEKDSNPGI